nr:MAG TPA: hypothetical protein [Caudoviricetes sp.]
MLILILYFLIYLIISALFTHRIVLFLFHIKY